MKCPVCVTTDLLVTERQAIEIDYCPKCRGVWLDRGELDKIIERSAAAEYNAPRGAVSAPPRDMMPDKRKNDYPVRDYDDDDDDDDRRKWSSRERYDDDDYKRGKPYKKKSVLGEIFDIFD